MKNVRRFKDIKFVATKWNMTELFTIRKKTVMQQIFFWKLVNYRNGKTNKQNIQICMNEQTYSGLTIVEISKILMYKFWYNYEINKLWRKS